MEQHRALVISVVATALLAGCFIAQQHLAKTTPGAEIAVEAENLVDMDASSEACQTMVAQLNSKFANTERFNAKRSTIVEYLKTHGLVVRSFDPRTVLQELPLFGDQAPDQAPAYSTSFINADTGFSTYNLNPGDRMRDFGLILDPAKLDGSINCLYPSDGFSGFRLPALGAKGEVLWGCGATSAQWDIPNPIHDVPVGGLQTELNAKLERIHQASLKSTPARAHLPDCADYGWQTTSTPKETAVTTDSYFPNTFQIYMIRKKAAAPAGPSITAAKAKGSVLLDSTATLVDENVKVEPKMFWGAKQNVTTNAFCADPDTEVVIGPGPLLVELARANAGAQPICSGVPPADVQAAQRMEKISGSGMAFGYVGDCSFSPSQFQEVLDIQLQKRRKYPTIKWQYNEFVVANPKPNSIFDKGVAIYYFVYENAAATARSRSLAETFAARITKLNGIILPLVQVTWTPAKHTADLDIRPDPPTFMCPSQPTGAEAVRGLYHTEGGALSQVSRR